ncbi:hypothetical protein GCM10008959_07120 [Deinococcus seoulensis]|uniref:Uncharacterized protein n=2 Tax=Deinococcus TaxID=1298 RepID=A0ABQ2RR18_9DEIO|nr:MULTISPECIES: hypothetical protein [Deinococcus]GGR48579.1 hypothetical protein GCM10008959_07120 [Deinococcus seoulensis]GGS19813.1 hypothetical protein GCM10008961_09250 [Deinococcus knuensis]
MSIKDNFTPDEWFKVMTGPGRAGAAIVASSPSGLTGLVAEARALNDAIRDGVSADTRTPLLEAIAADLLRTAPDPAVMPHQERARTMQEALEQSLENVRQAAWLVSAKASPEDSAAYRQMLLSVAERTANAAKEGGFLGFGGELVNDRERAVLDDLRRILNLEAAPAPTDQPSPDGSGNSG